LHNGAFENRHDVAVSYRATCLKALPGPVQGLMRQPFSLTQCVALDAGAESKACFEEPSGDCRSRSGERCEEHYLPGGLCGHLLRSHIPAPQALLLGPQAALLRCRLCPLALLLAPLLCWDLHHVSGSSNRRFMKCCSEMLLCMKQVLLQRSDCTIQYNYTKKALARQITPCLMCSKMFECTNNLPQQLLLAQQASW